MTGDITNNNSDRDYTEKAYTTSEIATMLGLAVPTIRKYSQHLEKEGYSFVKGKVTGKQQARLFTEKDITALRYFKELRTESNIKVEQAASLIVNKFGKGSIQDVGSANTTEIRQYKEPYNELKELIYNQTELINRQNEAIKELSSRLDQQQNYFDNRLKERDQLLLHSIDERLEAKRQIAAVQEIENKPGFSWKNLFKKGQK